MDFRLWLENYRGNHTPSGKGSGSPLHDLSDTYPDDIYGPDAVRNYGTREPWDYASISIIQQARNRPNMPVKIYRAVPIVLTSQDKIKDLEKQKKYILKYGRVPPYVTSNMDKPGKRPSNYYDFISDELEKIQQIDEPKVKINNGDWVTINRQYAVEHGKGQLGRYRILSKTVKAKDLYTTGDSIHEWGYDGRLLKEEVVDTGTTGYYGTGGKYKEFPFNIYKNPNKQELLEAIEQEKEIRLKSFGNEGIGAAARAFVSPFGDIYVWPESAAEHEDTADKLGESIQTSFYIDDRLKISTGYLSDFALQRIKENPNYKRMMGEKVADNPNYSPSKIWAEIPKPSWKDALRKKVEPGGVAKLPYESVLI